ncbi:MAG TPA: MarR family winged helix-turn-helix transcriptional regulator [Polyangiaceae bacterium]|nr:MarR family winged helix-turn-helix transcriptional regulator [Polyangiaceae bacterium]
MEVTQLSVLELRHYRNSRLYRALTRTLRVYNRMLLTQIHERGFRDFSAAFPQILSNLDTQGTRVGVLATRAGMTRQAAGQLLAEIERCGYVTRKPSPDDARVTIVRFTARGRRLLQNIFELVEEIEGTFAEIVGGEHYLNLMFTLSRLASEIDPEGTFGSGDEANG